MIVQLSVFALIVLIVGYFCKVVFSKDRALIFHPLTIISMVYVYYCIVPYYTGGNERYHVDAKTNLALFHVGALLSYICLLFASTRKINVSFSHWNNCFKLKRMEWAAILCFALAFVGYSSFRGVHFSIFAEDNELNLVHNDIEHYFLELLYLYEAAFSLFLMRGKVKGMKWWYIPLMLYIVISFIFAGTRARLVVMIASAITVYYLWPCPRRVNYVYAIVLATGVFLGFSIMDKTRQYSKGLNREALNEISYNDIKGGADENYSVYWFSAVTMDYCQREHDYVYFEPILNALLSPIPRSVFPWKPDGRYLMRSQIKIIGTADHGAIFLYFTEGFFSFGWLGVILWPLLLGWFVNLFWTNYRAHSTSPGAILALALFNGYCYNTISRGYLATNLINYVYLICLPFWLYMIMQKWNKTKIKI
ncbi:MAG: hypothetical protein IJ064_06755 [Bacteroidaceae bacterium]|nr:hypothetical protein [Bacteroidaceae bacterium]